MSDEIPPAPGGFTVGSNIAGYRLEEQIGHGGMAVVFRAHDPRLDRMVALKILAPELARDGAFRQRFIRESRAAAAVDHPHIIPVFEAGEAGGVLFIAMRYVQGRDVRTLLDEQRTLPPARAVSVVTQVASALDAAHSHGLVHRDVKPANMLLDTTAGSGRPDHVYLSDFGLSKQSLSSSGLTGTGQFLGTLDYVAPEQIEGKAVDGRTDLYALAGTAFEMLGGVPPFKRDQGLAVLWAQISEQPPRLTERRPDLPPAVDEVMLKALAKAPGDRYAYCLDFAAALREACGLRPEDASDPGVVEPARPASGGQPARPRQATEVAMPSSPPVSPAPAASSVPPESVPAASAGLAAAAAGQPRSAGPPTEAARIPTNPGLTDPSAPTGGYSPLPGGAPPGYGPVPGFGPGAGYGQQPGNGRPSRPWWRSRGVLAAAAAAVVLVLLGGGYVLLGLGTGTGSGGGGSGGGGGGGGGGTAEPKLPGCTTAVASARALSKVTSASVSLGGQPFAVTTTPDGKFSFVTLGNSLAVLRNGSALAPTLAYKISVPGANKGEAITSDGKYLLLATGSGAKVISVADAEQGNLVLAGTLASPGGRGAVQVTLSADGKFAFVTLQSSGGMAVFNLQQALASNFTSSGFVGIVPTAVQPVGVTESPDHKWLYVTSIEKVKTTFPSAGMLSVVSVHKAETKPARAVVSTVTAGCSPVRVIVSKDGSVVWVTVRESDALLGFSATKLRKDPRHALIARVEVGEGPIGLSFVAHGKRIIVANSDLKSIAGATPSLSVVSTSLALSHKPALLGSLKTGALPRQFYAGGKTLLVTNYGSGQLQAIKIADLP